MLYQVMNTFQVYNYEDVKYSFNKYSNCDLDTILILPQIIKEMVKNLAKNFFNKNDDVEKDIQNQQINLISDDEEEQYDNNYKQSQCKNESSLQKQGQLDQSFHIQSIKNQSDQNLTDNSKESEKSIQIIQVQNCQFSESEEDEQNYKKTNQFEFSPQSILNKRIKKQDKQYQQNKIDKKLNIQLNQQNKYQDKKSLANDNKNNKEYESQKDYKQILYQIEKIDYVAKNIISILESDSDNDNQ
ncbi:hypothetical protein PPERSA_03179 [Pseudocohnilembus persalinus]|uniref:Uncharacterized protein n=1 Tax=Pseudocohnilembus persalinus TaxID=266149 RepID=A0A0V0QE14_PSEPJ|nr:hypothetical protein PPERSA_03179 [Pseudocohnilembus persalinus]|eukprot:KRX00446.1 hypothetical protein PPERSA_03179 [Pseudocohnilembus persalinus]